jgi:hypothetical protein
LAILKKHTMKKTTFIFAISALLLMGVSSCYKTCEDPFAPNYTLNGTCIDLTASITGNYYGQLQDSIVGLHSTTIADTLQITKVDDAHVTVSSTASVFVSYNATVSASGNGYYLTVPSQSSSNGLTVTGGGAYFSSAADGVYISATKQLSVYALAGTQYEGFNGTQH